MLLWTITKEKCKFVSSCGRTGAFSSKSYSCRSEVTSCVLSLQYEIGSLLSILTPIRELQTQ